MVGNWNGSGATPANNLTVKPSFESTVEADPTFVLREVYAFPNPARKNPSFHIEVGLADEVDLRIYNEIGQKVHEATLIQSAIIDNKYAYEYLWDAGSQASGVYLYFIEAKKAGANPIKSKGKLAIVK